MSAKIRDLANGLSDSSTKQKLISIADQMEETSSQLRQENGQLKQQVASLQQKLTSLGMMSSKGLSVGGFSVGALIDETWDEIEYNEEKLQHQAQELKVAEREATPDEFADDKPEKTREFWTNVSRKLKEGAVELKMDEENDEGKTLLMLSAEFGIYGVCCRSLPQRTKKETMRSAVTKPKARNHFDVHTQSSWRWRSTWALTSTTRRTTEI